MVHYGGPFPSIFKWGIHSVVGESYAAGKMWSRGENVSRGKHSAQPIAPYFRWLVNLVTVDTSCFCNFAITSRWSMKVNYSSSVTCVYDEIGKTCLQVTDLNWRRQHWPSSYEFSPEMIHSNWSNARNTLGGKNIHFDWFPERKYFVGQSLSIRCFTVSARRLSCTLFFIHWLTLSRYSVNHFTVWILATAKWWKWKASPNFTEIMVKIRLTATNNTSHSS